MTISRVALALALTPAPLYGQMTAREVAPFQSSATEQDFVVRTYGYQLLSGPAAVLVGLEVVRRGGWLAADRRAAAVRLR